MSLSYRYAHLTKSFQIRWFKDRLYTTGEIVYGAKFVPMYYPNKENLSTVLDLDKINEYKKEELPESVRNKE
ncbi:hypothetical protein [Chryseobacterium indologenes]|uniref:hypothetical protein n=1 Tax=Chryseobacterium indologenes TaxID=253 RepID=UPI001EE6F53E|nr:hypothetical protein [Chryseobacterium indologenes]